jgi:hypothetical protein
MVSPHPTCCNVPRASLRALSFSVNQLCNSAAPLHAHRLAGKSWFLRTTLPEANTNTRSVGYRSNPVTWVWLTSQDFGNQMSIINQTKKLLSEERHRISLHDLLAEQIRKVISATAEDNFSASRGWSKERFVERLFKDI